MKYKDFDINAYLTMNDSSSSNSSTNLDLTDLKVNNRALRVATLTPGTIHIKSLPFLKSGLFSRDRSIPNAKVSLFGLPKIHCDAKNVATLVYSIPSSSHPVQQLPLAACANIGRNYFAAYHSLKTIGKIGQRTDGRD